ncbi:hypothetical protein ACX16L_23175 [Bacillus cereus]
MSKQSIAYSIIHEYLLGRYPTVASYDDRIIAQKIGFLSQSFGIYVGDVKFFWHKRGPYSRTLTSLLFSIEKNKQDIIEEASRFIIRDELKPRLNKVKKLIDKKPENCPEVYWLEICASLKYISAELSVKNGERCKEVLLARKNFLIEHEDSIDFANSLLF